MIASAKLTMEQYLLAEYGYFLTLVELATVIKVSKHALYKQIHEGRLDIPFIKRGKQYLFPTVEVATVLESQIERF